MEEDYKYKIIIKKQDNDVANTIFHKVKNIVTPNKRWLVNNLKMFTYNHLRLPLYNKKDIELIIYEYGIQNVLQYFILNKKKYNEIMELIESEEEKLIYGIAAEIIFEYFEFRIITN